MKVTEKTQKETVEKILNTSLKEFATHGYEGAKMRSIAKKAGVSLGVAYNYFKNKDEILIALITRFFEHRDLQIENAQKKISDKELPIYTYLSELVKDIQKNDSLYRLQLSLVLQPQIMKQIKGNKEPFKQLDERDRKMMELITQTAKKDLNIDASLTSIFIVGLIMLSLANIPGIDIETLPRQLVDRFKKSS